MARLIAVSDHEHVAAGEFLSVEINCNREVVATLRDGRRVHVTWGYGQTAWETRDALVTMINQALEE